ncbi:MFS transporter [Sporomusa aerivorans]|uniref:MFS transporter n=1 Tax=Sporomusa aerivorans TaxID=204936 RepID=UPI00352A2E95
MSINAMMRAVPRGVPLVGLGHMVTDLSQGALLVALPYFKAKFGLSYAEVTAIALMQNLTSSVIQPVFGYWSDRNPRPWLMAVGCLFSGLAMLASLLVPSYWQLLICTACTGLGIAAFHPEGAKTVNRLSGAAKGKGVSMFVVGGNAGFALGSLIMGLLLAEPFTGFLWVYAVPCMLTSLFLYKLVAALPPSEVKGVQSLSGLKGMFSVSLLALLGVVLMRATVSSGISTFIPLYYVSYLKGDAMYAGSLLTVFLAAGAAGTLAGGVLSDRFGSKKIMLWSIIPVSVLLAVFNLAPEVGVYAVLSIISACLSAAFASSMVLTQRMMPGNVGMASGLTLGFSVGLGSMGVLLLGRIADIWSLPAVFDILAFLPLVAFGLTLLVNDQMSGGRLAVTEEAG